MKIMKEIWMVIMKEWRFCDTDGSVRHHQMFALHRVLLATKVVIGATSLMGSMFVLILLACLLTYLRFASMHHGSNLS